MSIRVFIYDDSNERRDSLKALLMLNDRLQFVGEAMNCSNVLSDIENTAPDVVLMDIKMPRLDGYSATQEIRMLSNVPVIAQTAYALSEEREARYIVAKYDRAIVLWVNTAFHNRTSVSDTGPVVKGYCWGERGSSSGAFTKASAAFARWSDGR